MSLTDAPANMILKISSIHSGSEVRKKLLALGIHIDDNVMKVGAAKWGPVLVKNLSTDSSKLALGRGLAEKINVEYEN